MGADNWSNCPKCKLTKEKEIEKAESKLTKDYGQISFETFQKRAEAIEGLKRKLAESTELNTVREDYEIGIDGQNFVVDFRSYCHNCDFAFTYKVTFDTASMTEISRDVRPNCD